jgi:hypothetical protein
MPRPRDRDRGSAPLGGVDGAPATQCIVVPRRDGDITRTR